MGEQMNQKIEVKVWVYALTLVLSGIMGIGSASTAAWVARPDLDLAMANTRGAAVERCIEYTDGELGKLQATLDNVRLRAVGEAVAQSRGRIKDEIGHIERRLGSIEEKLDKALERRR